MAIAFQTSTTTGIGSASTGVINVPSGTVNGDMLLLAFALEESGASPIVTGWTQAATVDGGGTQDNLTRVWYRRASSEPASYTVTFGGSYGDSAALAMLRYTGVVSSGSPLRTTATVSRVASLGTPQTSAALTGVLAGDMAVHAAGVVKATWNSAAYTLAGPGGSWSQRASIVASADSVPGVLMIDQLGTGTAPACTAAGTGATNTAWCFCALALIPEPEATGANHILSTALRRASTW